MQNLKVQMDAPPEVAAGAAGGAGTAAGSGVLGTVGRVIKNALVLGTLGTAGFVGYYTYAYNNVQVSCNIAAATVWQPICMYVYVQQLPTTVGWVSGFSLYCLQIPGLQCCWFLC
jgi:hypothetical protein